MATPHRRYRLLSVVGLAQMLLHILGTAGESLGMDRLIKVITFKTRVHSLYHQGQSYLQLHPKIPQAQERQAEPLALCCADL